MKFIKFIRNPYTIHTVRPTRSNSLMADNGWKCTIRPVLDHSRTHLRIDAARAPSWSPRAPWRPIFIGATACTQWVFAVIYTGHIVYANHTSHTHRESLNQCRHSVKPATVSGYRRPQMFDFNRIIIHELRITGWERAFGVRTHSSFFHFH